MGYKVSSNNPLAYMGVEPTTPAQFVVFPKDPTPNNINFNLGTQWLNSMTQVPWILVNLAGGKATWIKFAASGGGAVLTLTTEDATVVPPSAGNIDIYGGTGITTVGNAGDSTVTIDLEVPVSVANGGTGATTFTPDSLLLGNGTSGITALGVATDGQIPIGSTGNPPVLATITAGSGITVTDGPGSITIAATGPATGHPLITTYSTPGTYTWTKNTGTTYVAVYGIGGGYGGGSGAREASDSSTGGGGGASNNAFSSQFPASFIGSTATVVVGAGGAGGASVLTDNTLGNNGVIGGVSSFGDLENTPAGPTASQGGQYFAGAPNSTSIAQGGTPNGPVGVGVTDPGSSVTQLAGGSLYFNLYGYQGNGSTPVFAGGQAGGGGGGNGATTGTPASMPAPWQAGAGGSTGLGAAISAQGGAAGTIGSPNGVNGADAPSGATANGVFVYGAGGGGGFGQTSSSLPGTGGNGGFPGGGGGGGGGSLNGTASGAGGNGANGIVYVIEW